MAQARRSTGSVRTTRAATAAAKAAPTILGVAVRSTDWLTTATVRRPLATGTAASTSLRVPDVDAQRILRSVVRTVADLPTDSSPDVVWVQGDSELLVHTNNITLACTVGLITVTLAVNCDQLPSDKPIPISVPFVVGTDELPAGLLMTTLRRPDGPDLVVDVWADAVTAFCWEAILELARALCGQAGKDSQGRPLIPGSIGAASRTLTLLPMARHDFAGRALGATS